MSEKDSLELEGQYAKKTISHTNKIITEVSGKIADNAYGLTSTGSYYNTEVSDDGFHNGKKTDWSTIGKDVADAVGSTANNTDYKHGVNAYHQTADLLGAGTLSKKAAVSDLRNTIYSTNSNTSKVHAALNDHATAKYQSKIIANSSSYYGAKFTASDADTAAISKTNLTLSKYGLSSSMSKKDVLDLLHGNAPIPTGALTAKEKAELTQALREKQFQIDYSTRQTVNYVSGTQMGHSRVITDYRSNQKQLTSYLRDRGISENLNNNQLKAILKKGTYTDRNGTKITIDSATKAILEEKVRLNDASNLAKRAAPMAAGGLGTAVTWGRQALKDTDTGKGMQTAQNTVTSVKAGYQLTKGSIGLTGVAATEILERTGRIAVRGGQLVSNAYSLGQEGISILENDSAKRSKIRQSRDNMNTSFNAAHEKVQVYGQKGKELSASFMQTSLGDKIKIVGSKVTAPVGNWHVVVKAKESLFIKKENLKNTKAGRGLSSVFGFVKKRRDGINNFLNGLNNSKFMKALRAPVSAKNWFDNLQREVKIKIALIACAVLLIDIAALYILLGPLMILPTPFLAGEETVEQNVGNVAIDAMLAVQNDFLHEVEEYMNDNCELEDDEGNPLHTSHNAYFNRYMGDRTDTYTNLSSSIGNSSVCELTTGVSQPYDISVLYKTIISMATTATENEAEDEEFYAEYCCLLLKKILHQSTITDNEDGTVSIDLMDVGLTDAMVLDSAQVECDLSENASFDEDWHLSDIFNYHGCGGRFEAVTDGWMHNHGHNSMAYKVRRHANPKYHTWNGWNTEPHNAYDWALNLWELSNEDWELLNINLPGFVGGGNSGSALSPSLIESTAEALREAGISEDRINAIMIAMSEVGKHVYGVRDGGQVLSYRTDCSGFISGVLQSAGLYNTSANCHTLATSFPPASELLPGTIIVKNDTDGDVVNGQVVSSNHVVMYLGAVEGYGEHCIIECSRKKTYTNGIQGEHVDGVSISGFNNLSQMWSHYPDYQFQLNPYGD